MLQVTITGSYDILAVLLGQIVQLSPSTNIPSAACFVDRET